MLSVTWEMLPQLSPKPKPLSDIMLTTACPHTMTKTNYRVLQLFGNQFMRGHALLVLRISSKGALEADVVRGEGAVIRGPASSKPAWCLVQPTGTRL